MPRRMPYKPGLVERGRWHFLKPLLLGALLSATIVVCATHLFAAGTARVTWDQTGDCVAIDRWELVAAAITAGQPNPDTDQASIVGTFPNAPPFTCGPGMQATAPLTLAGPYRFWLRNVTTGANAYAYSPPVDRVVPLAPPANFDVRF